MSENLNEPQSRTPPGAKMVRKGRKRSKNKDQGRPIWKALICVCCWYNSVFFVFF